MTKEKSLFIVVGLLIAILIKDIRGLIAMGGCGFIFTAFVALFIFSVLF